MNNRLAAIGVIALLTGVVIAVVIAAQFKVDKPKVEPPTVQTMSVQELRGQLSVPITRFPSVQLGPDFAGGKCTLHVNERKQWFLILCA